MDGQELQKICDSMMKTGIFHDEEQALAVLRASIKALRDRLPKEEAFQMAARLPGDLRDWVFHEWHEDRRRSPSFNKSDFLAEVELYLRDIEEHSLTETVPVALREILQCMDEDDAAHLKGLLPRSMQNIFNDRMSM
jgi:uncharacterized protein (DUF2267 family)